MECKADASILAFPLFQVLVVEDTKDMQEVLCKPLSRQGCFVKGVASAEKV